MRYYNDMYGLIQLCCGWEENLEYFCSYKDRYVFDVRCLIVILLPSD